MIRIVLGLALAHGAAAQRTVTTCSSNVMTIGNVDASSDCESFNRGKSYTYPADFTLKNAYGVYECAASKKRIIISNGVTDHSIKQGNPNNMCALPWWIELPLDPAAPAAGAALTEPPSHGLNIMGLNGVPAFGAQEAAGDNAFEHAATAKDGGMLITDAKYWYGHASPFGAWHYHTPHFGFEKIPNSTTMVGYAMDGVRCSTSRSPPCSSPC